ncbi:hypothetical protein ACQPZG_04775 (plasmid) [Streptomyces sp. CA-294286]|uniref:hypothetical protein n=1 Tax=Streptomyces sp. CA-294286 TaxID=3240070 RepID=UPI003D919009
MFNWIWIAAWVVVLLPPSLALLFGRAPSWLRKSASERASRMRGVAGMLLLISALSPALLSKLGISDSEFLVPRIIIGPLLILCSFAVIIGAAVVDRRDRTL